MTPQVKLSIFATIFFIIPSSAYSQDELQVAIDNLTQTINASVARNIDEVNDKVNKIVQQQQMLRTSSDGNTMNITCTDSKGNTINITIAGTTQGAVITNCETDDEGNIRITTKEEDNQNGSYNVGTIEIEGNPENTVIINNRKIDSGTNIATQGKNAHASVGSVKIKGNQAKDSFIMNTTTIEGGTVRATGEDSSVSIGTVKIGD